MQPSCSTDCGRRGTVAARTTAASADLTSFDSPAANCMASRVQASAGHPRARVHLYHAALMHPATLDRGRTRDPRHRRRTDSENALADPGLVRLEFDDRLPIEFDWGQPHQLGTAAYWVQQTRLRRPWGSHRLGNSLAEETVACILGGFGLPAKVGLAAFEQVRSAGLISLSKPPSARQVRSILEQPMTITGQSTKIRYRFPRQRADRVSAALKFLAQTPRPQGGAELREWLLEIPGVGPKTASWIARNWMDADVAIIDVHIRRAGMAGGWFKADWKLPRDYAAFEQAFVAVAAIGHVRSADLDARIWRDLSYMGRASALLLGEAP